MQCTIDRFEGNQAVLRTEDRQELVVPTAELPAGAAEGSVVFVQFTLDAHATTQRTAQAKDILNELIGTDE